MYSMEEIVLHIVMVMATMWIVDRYWRTFFEKIWNIYSIAVWITFGIFQIFFEMNIGNINIGVTLVNILLFLLVAIAGYNSKGKEKYFLLIIFYAVWSLIEMMVFFLVRNADMEKDLSDTLGMVISKIVAIILVYILSMIWNKRISHFIPGIFYFYLLLIPLGSIYIAISEFYSKGNNFLSIITISILLLFNVVVFELYIKLDEIFIYEKEKTVCAKQLEIVSKNTEEQKKLMEEFYEEKHNLVNELIALKIAVECNDSNTVVNNLSKIINNCNTVEMTSKSGNSTIDAIINSKYTIAKQEGIDFNLNIFVPSEVPIEQCDLGVVLGNAIDNAIEATQICKMSEKVIEISIGVKKEALVIIVKNPYENNLVRDRNGNYLSTKMEKSRHGFGLNSIKRIIARYEGETVIKIENRIFSMTIIMNLSKI